MIKIKYKLNIEDIKKSKYSTGISNMHIKTKESSPFEELMLISMLIKDLAQRVKTDNYEKITKNAVGLLKDIEGENK